MISIADTYDVMTARDSYRDPVSSAEAIAELRRVSGAQLDGELVEIFVATVLGHQDGAFATATTPTSRPSSPSGGERRATAGEPEPQLSAA